MSDIGYHRIYGMTQYKSHVAQDSLQQVDINMYFFLGEINYKYIKERIQ